MDIHTHIPTQIPLDRQNNTFFFSFTPVGQMAEHFRVNFKKYLPQAESMENFGPNGLSLAKLHAIENRIL